MRYSVVLTKRAKKQLDSMDEVTRLMIMKWMAKHLDDVEDPFASGHGLKGDKKGFWRYRVGNYRIIAKIEKGELLILVIEISDRSKVYQ